MAEEKKTMGVKITNNFYALSWEPGYSRHGSEFSGYSANNRSASGYLSSGTKIGGYLKRQNPLYSASLLPVPYGKLPDPLKEMSRMYRKRCHTCGRELQDSGKAEHGYGFN